MATITSTIFIGTSHPNHSGINPSHLILLSENSIPSFILYNLSVKQKEIILIPTIENTMHDLFLIIAIYVLKSLPQFDSKKNARKKSLYDIINESERKNLYSQTKKLLKKNRIKVVLNLFEGSHLLSQLNQLKEYKIDCEVTTTTLKREFNVWSNKIEKKEEKF